MRRLLPVFLVAATPVVAQRTPDPIDGRRLIRAHDVRAILDAAVARAAGDTARAFDERAALRTLTDLARRFVTPSLADPGDVQALGKDAVVLRGTPRQQVSLQGLVAGMAEGAPVHVGCRLFTVGQAEFATEVLPALGLSVDSNAGGATAAVVRVGEADVGRVERALAKAGASKTVSDPASAVAPIVTQMSSPSL